MRLHRVVVTGGDPSRKIADDWVSPADLADHIAEFVGSRRDVRVFVDGYEQPAAELEQDEPELRRTVSAVHIVRELTELLLQRERELSRLQVERERELSKLQVDRERQLNGAWETYRACHAQAQEDLAVLGRCVTGTRIKSMFHEARRDSAESEGDITWQHFLRGTVRVLRKFTTDGE